MISGLCSSDTFKTATEQNLESGVCMCKMPLMSSRIPACGEAAEVLSGVGISRESGGRFHGVMLN